MNCASFFGGNLGIYYLYGFAFLHSAALFWEIAQLQGQTMVGLGWAQAPKPPKYLCGWARRPRNEKSLHHQNPQFWQLGARQIANLAVLNAEYF